MSIPLTVKKLLSNLDETSSKSTSYLTDFFHEIEFPQIPVSINLLVISELVPGMFLNGIGQNFAVEVPGLLKKFM
ncbi:hypothetical protein MSSAC_1092 [Methanosarcina siciliae C2J]|uniref:Uncharacterized protein n=1 Tax=Methanosarcina siciliae C2J TaxID=1434118 RepID=A0A0E3PLJ7_9EURY|nr:hypothetical protein [Methanosarcina siciliae]AKB35682.1 hypothetical protein MSSAC_1092 [Methanosarcina siciliae C2J]